MPEVHSVHAIVRNPSGPGDPGQITLGHYTVSDGILTMTNGEGAAVRSTQGERYQHKLMPEDDARLIASRLTLKIYGMVRGGDMAGFNRPISYPRVGLA